MRENENFYLVDRGSKVENCNRQLTDVNISDAREKLLNNTVLTKSLIAAF